jgi:hypothetical protein
LVYGDETKGYYQLMSFGVRTYEKGMRKGMGMRKRKEEVKIEDKRGTYLQKGQN